MPENMELKNEEASQNTMNQDLQLWSSKSKDQPPFESSDEHTGKKLKGKCQICGKNKATAVCLKCGKLICNSHFYHILGVCENCLSKETVEKWKKNNPNWEKILGVDWLD